MKYACCKSTTGGATDSITCTKCNQHYHYQCLYPSKALSEPTTNAESKKRWTCPDCMLALPRQTVKDNTPVRSQYSKSNSKTNINENVTVRRGASASSTLSPDKDDDLSCNASFLDQVKHLITSEISSLKVELKSSLTPLQNELKSLRDELSSMRESLEFVHGRYDDCNNRIDKCESELKQLSSKCLEIEDLKSKIDLLESENNNREQWARKSNIEIYGIPEKNNENLYSVLQNISQLCNYNLNIDTDIDFITRVVSRDKDAKKIKPIIVRFLCRYKKDDFLAKVRKLKLKCHDIGFISNNSSIYFNDHLTSSNKALLQRVKKIAKEKHYQFVWVKKCTIMVRRNSSSPVLHIGKLSDLKKIV